MCGIFGYVGNRTATPLLIDGLRTLEYRGYDSAGIYVPGYGAARAVGPIDNLTNKITANIPGTVGIAHTRWATHGAPTVENAHPHTDMQQTVYIVHNGIIENYQDLKDELRSDGVRFAGETDTEVLVALVASYYKKDSGDLSAALRAALSRVRGTYGIAAVAADAPAEVVVARMGSPIVLGVSPDGHIVSSDPSALLAYTKDVVYLDDGEMAVLTADTYSITTLDQKPITKSPETIQWDQDQIQKDGFDHFMLKEIFEAPEVVENTIRGRIQLEKGRVKLGGLEEVLSKLLETSRLTITACGSAYLAGYVGKYLLETYAKLPVDIELASEYRYKTNLPDKNGALLAITQSGETADTLAAIRLAKELDQLTLGIVNVIGSTIARETDAGVYNHAGPEVAVASTKAFISELVVLVLLTVLIARERDMDVATGKEILTALQELPAVLRSMLENASEIKAIAERYASYQNAMFIGRTTHTPIAFEGALKLKEVAYIHAEAYAGGELKHGSIALLDENFPVIALVPQDDVYEKMISNIEEVKARSAPVLAVATEGDIHIAKIADDVIYVPKVHPILQPIVSSIPLHLFSYYVGVAKDLNVDRPRNLAKSVTVE